MEKQHRSQSKTARRQKKPKAHPGQAAPLKKDSLPGRKVDTSEERFRQLFDHAGLGVFHTTTDGRIVAVTGEFARMFGYGSPEEFISLVGNAADVFADPQRRAEIIRLKAENPGLLKFENSYRRKDGSTFTGSLTLRQVEGTNGETFFEGLVEDITERKAKEEALRDSEATLKKAQRVAHMGTWKWNFQSDSLEWSDEMYSIFGMNRDTFTGEMREVITRAIHPDDRLKVEESNRSVQEEGRPIPLEYRVVWPDGSVHTVWAEAGELVKDEAGKPVSLSGFVQDITDRKRVEETLREKEQRYRAIFEGVEDAIFLETTDGQILDVNARACEMYGYSYEQFLNKTVMDLVPKESAIVPIDLEDSRNHYSGHPVETVNVRANGEQFPVEISIRVQKMNDTTVLFVVGRDITERKRAEEALRESEAILRESQIVAGLGSYVLEVASGNWKSSAVLDKVFGIDEAYERSVEGWVSLIHPDDQKMMADYLAHEVLGQGKLFNKEYRIIRRNDRVERWVHGLGRLEFNAQGTAVKMHGTIQDITERKRAEKALRESEQHYRGLVELSPDTIIIEQEDGTIAYINPAGLRVFGATQPEQIQGTNILDHIHPDFQESVRKRIQQIMKGKKSMPLIEEKYIRLDGSSIDVEVAATSFEYEGRPGVQVIAHDITARKKAAEALAHQAEELRRRNDELDRLYRASGSLISGASLSLQDLAQTIVEVVQQEFGQANCSLIIVQKDSNELTRLAIAGPYADQVKNKRLTQDGLGLVPQAIRTGAAFNVGNVHAVPDYLPNWEAAQSELAIPLKIGDHVIGVIDVQSSEPEAFGPDDERLMTIFVERAALVLEHSRLNAQTEARMQQLLALRTVDMAISSSFDLTLTLGILLDQITQLLGIHAVDILAFNAATQMFKFSNARGFRTQTLQHAKTRPGDDYAWRVVRERQMVNIVDIRAEANGTQRSLDLSAEQFTSYMGIPLLAKGQVKGVMEVFQREPLVLEPEGYAFLEMLAGQAAIAIDGAELFEHLQNSNAELSVAYDSTLEGWASALELRDEQTEGHTRRVARLATRLAQAVGVREEEILQIYRGALLHDIGKMGVPDNIMLKPGPLTEDEWVIMRKHPQFAYDMLLPITYLRPALDIPYCHHEKWDGTGYPRRLKGAQIPKAARIFAVVDVWDALTSDRPYRKAWEKEKASEYIREQAGQHFDPEVVTAFLDPAFPRE